MFQKRRIFGIIVDMKSKKRLQAKIYKTKDEAIAAGLKMFEKTEVARLFAENADFAIGEMALRAERMRKKKLPRFFGSIDYLAKDLLVQRTAPVVFFEKESDRPGSGLCRLLTPAYRQQRALVEAMHEYVHLGAAYAKKIGSSSVYQWVLALDTLEWCLECDSDHSGFCTICDEDAEEMFRRCQVATNRLRADMMIAELPSFESLRKKTKKTSRKAEK